MLLNGFQKDIMKNQDASFIWPIAVIDHFKQVLMKFE